MFLNNENIDYRKNYTPYYVFRTTQIESCSFVKDD